MSGTGRLYADLAPYYDAVCAGKDYRKESAFLERLARRHGGPGTGRWLDVACGTGRHLGVLRRKWAVVGVDASAAMLREARRRLPKVRGDMRAFDLGEEFDVGSCLFSAIGHLRSERDLLRAFRTFARHLRPGGVPIVEPWVAPTKLRPGHVGMTVQSVATLRVARAFRSARRVRPHRIQLPHPGRGTGGTALGG